MRASTKESLASAFVLTLSGAAYSKGAGGAGGGTGTGSAGGDAAGGTVLGRRTGMAASNAVCFCPNVRACSCCRYRRAFVSRTLVAVTDFPKEPDG
jgi:hypothetical protein